MAWFPFKFKKAPKSFLGIDIGTSSIRIVELSRKGQRTQLDNYGEIKSESFQKVSHLVFQGDSLSLSNQEISKAIIAVLKEAGIETRYVNFAVPDFLSFFTSFELPPMPQRELEQAVRYEARSYVPLPLSEITLDWQIVEGRADNKTKSSLKVLVAAIPNEVILQYQEIASLSELNIKALEAEVFALSRPLAKSETKITAILDIGARSTTANIFEKGILKISHSFNVSGNELTEILSRSLKIDYQKAEELKRDSGLSGFEGQGKDAKDILLPLVDAVLAEVKKTFHNFHQQEGKEVQKIILAGGSALMPGLKEYFLEELNQGREKTSAPRMEVEIADPFSALSFPSILQETLKEMGPSYAIAVGLALKGLE